MNPWDWWPETEHNMMTLSETLLHMWLLSFGIPAMRDMFSRTECVVHLVVVVAYTECDDLRVWTIFCAKYLLYKLYGWSYGTLRKDMRKNIECEICYINYLLYKSWISRSNFLELCHNFYEAISFSFEICKLWQQQHVASNKYLMSLAHSPKCHWKQIMILLHYWANFKGRRCIGKERDVCVMVKFRLKLYW